MNRRNFVKSFTGIPMLLVSGCLGRAANERSNPTLAVHNQREERFVAEVTIERWGGVDTQCDLSRTVSGETMTATVKPGKSESILPITEQGLYGVTLEFDEKEHVACLAYTGNERSFAWVVDAETVNFVSHTP